MQTMSWPWINGFFLIVAYVKLLYQLGSQLVVFSHNNVCRFGYPFFLSPSDDDAMLEIPNPTPSVHTTRRTRSKRVYRVQLTPDAF